jgi:hypothetical protein
MGEARRKPCLKRKGAAHNPVRPARRPWLIIPRCDSKHDRMTLLRNLFGILIAMGIFCALVAGLWFGLPRRLFEPVAICCLFVSVSIVFLSIAGNAVRIGMSRIKTSKYSSDVREFSRIREPGPFWLSVAMFGVFGVAALGFGIWALFAKY